MEYKSVSLPATKTIALVAHDNKKGDLLAWCRKHQSELAQHSLYATGTTGTLISGETGLAIKKLISGPLGGDQQVGALITEGTVDMLIFFWDPFEPMPHDPDVKALLRIAAVWNIPIACNQSSADFIVSSPLFYQESRHSVPDYEAYMAKRAAQVS
jgi:methylglyoxal synthase